MASSKGLAHCDPVSPFLSGFSALSRTCVPTGAALASALFGGASVAAWVVVLLPQIVKHYRTKRVEGFTLLFLSLWIAGDAMALIGAFLTSQAAWQILLCIYYLTVDTTMLTQWYLYRVPPKADGSTVAALDGTRDEVEEFLLEDMDADSDEEPLTGVVVSPLDSKPLPPKPLPPTPLDLQAQNTATDANGATGHVRRRSSGSKSSPLRNALFGSAVARSANALPTSTAVDQATGATSTQMTSQATVGLFLAWPPTVLYVASRFPMLYRNYQRQSTAGLSPWFVVGTLCGNGFYLLGLLADPRARTDLPAYGGRGWVGAEGSDRFTWLSLVAPYLVGTAILVSLDVCIGAQFWMYRKTK